MKTTPNCKINLGLRVLCKRPDGYHDLETLFIPVPLCDELEITVLRQTSALIEGDQEGQCLFSQTGIPVDCAPEDNICVKAYNLLLNDFPQMPPVHIRLGKHIPFGAGLGGGSSDAAFTLCMLNEMFALGLSDDQLEQYAARLGADCAFFVRNNPAQALGIGDRLTPLDSNPLAGYRLVMAKPDDAVSTREAYAHIRLHDPEVALEPLSQAVRKPISTWGETIVNDFEASVFPSHPRIVSLKATFYAHGALYASMSGSGATVFALFSPEADLTALYAALDSTLLHTSLM